MTRIKDGNSFIIIWNDGSTECYTYDIKKYNYIDGEEIAFRSYNNFTSFLYEEEIKDCLKDDPDIEKYYFLREIEDKIREQFENNCNK